MKFARLFLLAAAFCALNACEKQPYSKVELLNEHGHAGGEHGHADAKAADAKAH